MRILLLITGLGMGGAEKLVVGLADALVAEGHLVCIAFMTGDISIVPKNKSIEVFDLGINSKLDIGKGFVKFRKLVDAFKPDVVHSHMVHANIFARLARLIVPMKKLISTAHSSNEGGRLRILAYRLTNFLSNAFTNVSAEAVDCFVNAGAVKSGQMMAVHNGVSTIDFYFNAEHRTELRKKFLSHDESQIILAVGRLVEAKDYENLLSAFYKLIESSNFKLSCKLLIAGDGPLRKSLEQLAVDLKINDYVKFLGIRHDIAALMSAADVFVLSSAWEGFGLVVAEAMACERVVVATDCGGVKEVVGDAGYLVPPRNSEKLMQVLKGALELNVYERVLMGRKARQQIIDNYSFDAALKKWINIYLEKSEI